MLFINTAPARSQIIGTLQADRLNLLNTYESGARPASLGGAFTAISDDAFALIYNPAGLTQIKKKELSFGIHYAANDRSNNYLGYNSLIPNSSTGISHLATVHPFPTYRGSLVLGFGIFRVGDSNLEYSKSAYLSDLLGTIRNTLNQTGTIYQYRFGAGIDISPKVAIGANLIVWDESLQFIEEISYEGTGDSTYIFSDDVSAGLDGLSMEIGFLFRLSRQLRAGLKISSPVWLSYEGDGIEYYDGSFIDPAEGTWTTDPYYYYIKDEYTLPMKFRGGISYQLKNLLISADAEYCDYTQTKYNGLNLYNEINPGKPVLKETVDFNMGAELTLPFYPIKLRAGYSYIPSRFVGLEEIAYVEETLETMGIYSEWYPFGITKKREFYSFGIGGLIDQVLKVDLNIIVGNFERESVHLSESTETTRISFSTAYRF
ncbi:UPF0164 family protein [bacterium]|nr:UPF0164 family protein [bacterium]